MKGKSQHWEKRAKLGLPGQIVKLGKLMEAFAGSGILSVALYTAVLLTTEHLGFFWSWTFSVF